MKKSVDLRKRGGLFGSRGSVLVMAAVFALVIIGMAALAIDIGMTAASKAQQENLSVAALACQGGLANKNLAETTRFRKFSSAYNLAKRYALLNKVMGVPVTLSDNDIEIGKWDTDLKTFNPYSTASANACRVTIPRATTLRIFSKAILPNYSSRISSKAVATYGASGKPLNLQIAQDITYSFNSIVKLNGAANTGDQSLITCVKNRRGAGSKVGLTTFDLKVEPYTTSNQSTTPMTFILDTANSLPMVDPNANNGAGATLINTKLADLRTPTCNTQVFGDPKCTNTQAGIVSATSALDTLFPGMTSAQILAQTALNAADYAIYVSTDGDPNQIMTSLIPTVTTKNSNPYHDQATYNSTEPTVIANYVIAEKAAKRWPSDAPVPTGAPTWFADSQNNISQTYIDNFYTYWGNYWKTYCGVPTVNLSTGNNTAKSDAYDSIAQACAAKAAASACSKGYKIYASYYVGSQNPSMLNVKSLTCNANLTNTSESNFFFAPTSASDLQKKAEQICLDATTLVYQK